MRCMLSNGTREWKRQDRRPRPRSGAAVDIACRYGHRHPIMSEEQLSQGMCVHCSASMGAAPQGTCDLRSDRHRGRGTGVAPR